MRVPRIVDAIAAHTADAVMLPEFRHGPSGDQLQAGLRDLGLAYQMAPDAPRGRNTVLIASRVECVEFGPTRIAPELRERTAVAELGDVLLIGTFCATKEMVKALFTFLCDHENAFLSRPTLVTGDFNCGPQKSKRDGYRDSRPLLDFSWLDVWKRDHQDVEEWCFRGSGGGMSQPDHVFASPGSRLEC